MKYIKIILSLVFFLNTIFASSQNLLDNPGFEDGNYNFDKPLYKRISNLDDWEDAHYWPSGSNVPTWHTVDWWDDYAHAHGGDKYIQIRSFELVEQKLLLFQRMQPGTSYLITFWINPKGYSQYNDQYDNYSIRVYRSENKMTYTSHVWCDFCDNDYGIITNSLLAKIEEFDLDGFYNDTWVELKFIHNNPVDAYETNYEWFGIELYPEVSYECNSTTDYVSIDDVSIVETDLCTLEPCIRTTGEMTPSAAASRPDEYITIYNLSNVSYASDIEIGQVNGQEFINFSNIDSPNGITGPLIWDGRKENGDIALSGTYYWQMDLTNECGTFPYGSQFVWNGSNLTPIDNLGFNDNSEVIAPLNCCSEAPDITINYDITGSGFLEIHAADDVILDNMTIENTVDDLHIIASNSILIQPGVKIELGTEVTFETMPCE